MKENPMEEKISELLGFFHFVLESADSEYRQAFQAILDKLAVEEKDIKKLKVENDKLKDILQAIFYSEKIRKALKKIEPPSEVRGYIDEVIILAKTAVKEFFLSSTPEARKINIKDETDTHFSFAAGRELFEIDKRILSTVDNVYRFDFSCYYSKEKQEIQLSFSTSFQVKESEIHDISAFNLNMFDNLAKALGFSCEPSDKNVYFNATITENETYCDNTCNLEWMRKIKNES